MKPVFALFALALLSSFAAAQDKDGKDDVVGAIWKFTMSNGTQKESGQFRVYRHVVFKGAKRVGTIQPRGTDTTLTITDFPKLNGKVELRKVKRDPPVWRGIFHKTDGTKWEIEVEIKDK
jgi:hypothetical protein